MTNAANDPSGKPQSNQTLLLVLGLIGAVAAIGAAWWGYSKQFEPVKPVTRKSTDFVMTWRCLACGETASDKGARGPRPCPKCGKPEMYVSIRWDCPTHGGQDVAYQYDDEGQPEQVKMGDKGWLPASDPETGSNVRCPTCNGYMIPAGSSPMRR